MKVIDPVVVVNDLSMHYPARRASQRTDAVSGVNFEIARGEILAVIGESGSGKSTVAKAVAARCDLPESSSPIIHGGSLEVLGRQIRGLSARKRDKLTLSVGYIPQDAGAQLAPHLTAGENVAEPIFERDRRFDQDAAGEAVATLIDAVRLPLATMNKYPYELSNGQRQRVAIARALILEPTLLIADNPTAGIDVTVRGTILDILRDVHRIRDFSALVIAADLDEVRSLTDRVMIMHKGLVAGIGSPEDVLDTTWHPYVEGLIRARRLLRKDQVARG